MGTDITDMSSQVSSIRIIDMESIWAWVMKFEEERRGSATLGCKYASASGAMTKDSLRKYERRQTILIARSHL